MSYTGNIGQLTFLIGLPRSGKSTLASEWLQERLTFNKNNEYFTHKFIPEPFKFDNYGRVVYNSDQVRLALYGQRYFQGGEKFISSIKYVTIEALLKSGHKVLVDGTHTSASSFKELFTLDKNAMWYFVDTPKETCVQRAIDCNQLDLVQAIERMDLQLQDGIKKFGSIVNYVEEFRPYDSGVAE